MKKITYEGFRKSIIEGMLKNIQLVTELYVRVGYPYNHPFERIIVNI